MFYWKIVTKQPGQTCAYIKTHNKYIAEMIVEIAIKEKMFCDNFVDLIDFVVEISKEEYLSHMWD